MNKPYHVVADGYKRLNIAAYNPRKTVLPSAQQESLDKFTQAQIKRAQEKGGVFFDGEMVGALMNSLQANNEQLDVATQKMSYSQHAGVFRTNPDAQMQALYVASITITADDKLVFGTAQATEVDWLGKLGFVAGGVQVGPDGMPSFGTSLYRELSEEIGVAHDYQVKNITPGWITGMSRREGNYHLSAVSVTELRLTATELNDYFNDWSAAQNKAAQAAAQRGERIKTEFKDLRFLPNDCKYLRQFIEEQDKNMNLGGKSLDVLDEWVRTYGCDIQCLKDSQSDARVYLPQPRI